MSTSVLDTWRAPVGTGYDPTAVATVERVLPMLAEGRVVWLSTVRPDGTPHLVPTWFWWDGTALVVYSKPGAAKVRNLRANPHLMLAVGDPEDDFSVGLVEARATLSDDSGVVPDAFFEKYAAELGSSGLDPETFRALYTQEIRIEPTRFLAWHGRSERHDATARVTGPASMPRRTSGVAHRLAAALERLSVRVRGVTRAQPAPATA